MTLVLQRPVGTNGVFTSVSKAIRYVDAVGVITAPPPLLVTRSPSGPSGRNAVNGYAFNFAGLISPGEAPLPQTALAAGTLSAVNSSATAKTASTTGVVFTLYINGVSAGTCTFAPNAKTGVWAFTATTYAKGDYLEVAPPAGGDGALYGASLNVLGF